MEVSKKFNLENKFSTLQSDYKKQLPTLISMIEDLWFSLAKNSNKDILKQLQHTLLRLANAGGTYGAEEVSYLARKLDLKLKSILESNNIASFLTESKETLDELFLQLKETSQAWTTSDFTEIKSVIPIAKSERNLVYILLGDDVFSTELQGYLEKYSYSTQCFNELIFLKAACEENKPAVIIVDDKYTENEVVGVNIIEILKTNKLCSPIIYISNSNNTESRLAATRAGADRYFCKPVTMNKIDHAIKGLNLHLNDFPYRILIIDNDVALLECYAAILSGSKIGRAHV